LQEPSCKGQLIDFPLENFSTDRGLFGLPDSDFTIQKGYIPGLMGRVGELHAQYYVGGLGWSMAFDLLVLKGLTEFLDGYDSSQDLILSAWVNGEAVGSIMILGRNFGPDGAQLRFFLVSPQCRGMGIGKALVKHAMSWCQQMGFPKVHLWTVDNLTQSRKLYEQAGFRVVECIRDDRYSVEQDNLKMEWKRPI